MKRIGAFLLAIIMVFGLSACGTDHKPSSQAGNSGNTVSTQENKTDNKMAGADAPDGFVRISGGTFQMGSPDTEAWRSEDETVHPVTVSDFYMGVYEVTQKEYQEVIKANPSNFTGDDLPVENLTWYEAVAYCNAHSEKEGLTKAYTVDGQNVTWERSADGYRLPTEAEWENACRAGTETPFNTQTSISPEESNYFGHYPYLIEENYFSQEKLDTEPGEYRETTVAVDSFSPNAWGLYNMHGNVGEWCWDYYGAYAAREQNNPSGAEKGTRRISRGGGWNDFAKHIRSAYRASSPADRSSAAVGLRLVRNAVEMEGSIVDNEQKKDNGKGNGSTLIVFFSWGGNTKGIAQEIQSQTGADLFEIELVHPYSDDYDTVLDEAQRDQNEQARPEIKHHVENIEKYETILLGYPIWWGEAPKIMYTFVESYDLSGKIIIPFCTSASSGIGNSATNLQTVTKGNATWIAGQRFAGSSSKTVIQQWIQGLDLSKTTSATGTVATLVPDNSTPKPSVTESPDVTPEPGESGQLVY